MEESLKKVFKEEFWDLSRIEFENKELKVFLQNENKKIQIIFEYVYSYRIKENFEKKQRGFFKIDNAKFVEEYIYQATGTKNLNVEDIKGYAVIDGINCYVINDDNNSIEVLSNESPKLILK
ncbi:MAG: hypothetical protein J6I85_02900 [Clostridia bacterium]|nr:hypothetical protein [Clostridia bacterium]